MLSNILSLSSLLTTTTADTCMSTTECGHITTTKGGENTEMWTFKLTNSTDNLLYV